MIQPRQTRSTALAALMEPLEDRQLLSVAHGFITQAYDFSRFAPHSANTITFDQAPAPIQAGLTTIAGNDSLSAPTSAQTIYLGDQNGTQTYSTVITGTGTSSKLTVDQNGNPITAPTVTTTTFGAITNTAVTDEISAIATALNLTAPDSTATVTVTTPASGPVIFTISLSPVTTTTGRRRFSLPTQVAVDDAGDPVGNQSLPLSVFSTTIQTGLTSNAPANATALSPTSLVTVRTEYGMTTYSATYRATGIITMVTVAASGDLANLPSTSVVQFSTLSATVQTALETYAADAGFTGTIDDTQNVTALDEGNGTVIYSVRVPITVTTANGGTYTYMITVSVDQDGNPTVPPQAGAPGEFGALGAILASFFGGGFGGC